MFFFFRKILARERRIIELEAMNAALRFEVEFCKERVAEARKVERDVLNYIMRLNGIGEERLSDPQTEFEKAESGGAPVPPFIGATRAREWAHIAEQMEAQAGMKVEVVE